MYLVSKCALWLLQVLQQNCFCLLLGIQLYNKKNVQKVYGYVGHYLGVVKLVLGTIETLSSPLPNDKYHKGKFLFSFLGWLFQQLN